MQGTSCEGTVWLVGKDIQVCIAAQSDAANEHVLYWPGFGACILGAYKSGRGKVVPGWAEGDEDGELLMRLKSRGVVGAGVGQVDETGKRVNWAYLVFLPSEAFQIAPRCLIHGIWIA